MFRTGLIFGIVVAASIAFWQWGQYAMMMHHLSSEVFAFIVGGIFLSLGVFLGLKVRQPVPTPSPTPKESPGAKSLAIPEMGLSPRELEVLGCLAEGLTNQQIADRLFVSLNTIKTHTTNLYLKLEVPNRTAAVAKAKGLGIVE
jgi:DNA-binding NarL/FixJ family response regulator